jgi:hypothetical protein
MKDRNPTYRLSTQVRKTAQHIHCMIGYPILRSSGPELNHIRIVSEGNDANFSLILAQQICRPIYPGPLVAPCIASTPGKTVNKYNTVDTTYQRPTLDKVKRMCQYSVIILVLSDGS